MKIPAILFLALLLAACGSSAPAASKPAAKTPVAMAWVAVSALQAIPHITKEGGYFDANGLDVSLQYLQGSPQGAAALSSGNVQLAHIPGPAVINADAQGAHEVMVMNMDDESPAVIMAVESIKKPEDLKGATFGITKAGTSDDQVLRSVLPRWNLKPDVDVKITALGDIPAQLAAVNQHIIQALVVNPPNDVIAEKAGMHVLARATDLNLRRQGVGIVTTREYAQAHHDVVLASVKAMTDGIHRFKTDRAFAMKVMSGFLKNDDQSVLESGYKGVADVFPEVPNVSKEAFQVIVDQERSTGELKSDVDVSSMIDNSFVDELQKSGFIKQLYGN